jgi:NIPSNAP protein
MRALAYALPAALAWTCALVATAAGGREMPGCCAVLELRQYTLKPGGRDVLVNLFEEHFVEPQEELRVRIVGTFRDAARSDRFVWLRGFPDMESRRAALEAFYTGPVWKANREAANATMIDTDNVLLLRPAGATTGFELHGSRAAGGEAPRPARVIVATVHYFPAPVDQGFPEWFHEQAVPLLARAGAPVLGQFVTEPAANTFPRLPVREGENVFVWFAAYPDATAASAPLDQVPGWRDRIQPRLQSATKGAPERIILEPTHRSLLR